MRAILKERCLTFSSGLLLWLLTRERLSQQRKLPHCSSKSHESFRYILNILNLRCATKYFRLLSFALKQTWHITAPIVGSEMKCIRNKYKCGSFQLNNYPFFQRERIDSEPRLFSRPADKFNFEFIINCARLKLYIIVSRCWNINVYDVTFIINKSRGVNAATIFSIAHRVMDQLYYRQRNQPLVIFYYFVIITERVK